MFENEIVKRQRKNERMLLEIKKTKLLVRYHNYRLKLMYKKDRTPIENFFLNHSVSTERLENIIRRK